MKKLIILLICCLAVAARAENIVSVSSANGHPQEEVTLNVSLANTDAAVAFQTEIPLGSQLTYVANSIALNPDRVTDHQVTAAVVNGNLRIYVYSLSLTPFVGNSGNLLSFTLKLKNEPGDYTLNMDNSKLSDASGTALPISTLNGTVTILSPKLSINTQTLNYGHVPIRSEYSQTAQVNNVGNEPLTITNIAFSDAVFSCPNFTETTLQPGASASFTFKFAPILKGALTATATIVSNSISGNGTINLIADPFAVNEIHVGNTMGYCDSIVALPISMNNMENIMGFQIEANLNDALEFVDFILSDRKTDHVATGIVNGTTLRLMAYSPTGAAFTDEDGMLGTVRFLLKGQYGNYNLNPFKAVLADANGEDALSAKYQGRITIRSPKINGNNSLSFGSTPVTETVTKEYVVRNNGNAQMRIDQVIFDQSDFAVAETFPITINQNSSATLHVSYNREQKGDFSALMKIYSNDPQNGLKNVALSGHRYEPNSLGLSVEPSNLDDGGVSVAISLNNYSDIVALQADFRYPYEDYSISSSDFQLTDRFANHQLYAIPTNDSTYRVLVLSMQNTTVDGHDGDAVRVTMHLIGEPSVEDYTVSVSNVVLSEMDGIDVFTGEEAETTFSLAISQTASMVEEWNWWSTYIELNGIDGIGMLEAALGENAISINSQTAFTMYYGENGWWGSLSSINNESMYRLKMYAPTSIMMTGLKAKPLAHPITVTKGWNHIGFISSEPMGVENAFAGLEAAPGDIVKNQTSYAIYYDGYGWYGSLTMSTIRPGDGLMYKSVSDESKTFTYPANSFNGNRLNEALDQTHWTCNAHAYPSNMTMLAVVELDGLEVNSDDYELAVFADDGCRGSIRLMYVDPIDRYVAFLTMAGDEAKDLRFALYNTVTGETVAYADERLMFTADEVIGDFNNPLVLHFRNNGHALVYPNPTNGKVTVEADAMTHIAVTNALGHVVYDANANGDKCQLELGNFSAGVYLVRISTQNGIDTERLTVVK